MAGASQWHSSLSIVSVPGIETKALRDKNIHDALVKYDYTLKEIVDHLKIHHTTVSKVVSKREKE